LAAGILLFAILAWVVPRHAAGGFCQGRREGIRLYLEYLGRQIEKRVLDSFFDIELLANGLSGIPLDLALWSLHLQARARLSEMLTKTGMEQVGRRPSYEDVRATLQPFWSKAAAIQRTFKQAEVNPKTALNDTLRDIVIRWSTCQALASRSLAPCDLVGGLDPRRRKGCRLDMVRLVTIYGGACSGDLADQAAEILGMSLGKLRAACEILSKGQIDRCKEFGEFEYLCLAFCKDEESACRTGQQNDKRSEECVKDLHAFETITGKKTIAQFEKRYPDSRRLLMVRAMLGREDCLHSALRQYDQRASIPFLLQVQTWQWLSYKP